MKLRNKNYFLVKISWFEIINEMPLNRIGDLCKAFFMIADGENYVSDDETVNMVLELFKTENGFR